MTLGKTKAAPAKTPPKNPTKNNGRQGLFNPLDADGHTIGLRQPKTMVGKAYSTVELLHSETPAKQKIRK